jgi:glycosyltransferase involved in cell wall biosynthesis
VRRSRSRSSRAPRALAQPRSTRPNPVDRQGGPLTAGRLLSLFATGDRRAGILNGREATPPRGALLIVRTAFVSTYPPRRCGIATFTSDLAAAIGGAEIAVLHPGGDPPFYPTEVEHRIRKEELSDYVRTARSLSDCADVVSIQHEYGIWGGDDGEHVLELVRGLRVPAVATLHTVLREPTPHQHAVLLELIRIAEATVVMSRSAADLLRSSYGVDQARVHVIPHGVPDLPLVNPETVKPGLGIGNRKVILSFGLLGPSKGLELAIDALPSVAAAHPSVLYVIVGATHPSLMERDGEAYRTSLVERIRSVGMTDHVEFVDRFVGKPELSQWLEAADVFVTPYPNLGQIVSGTLSYAMGAGRAIVSTPYVYATELLAGGRGILVRPGSVTDLSGALNQLLGDPALRHEIGRRAYDYSRGMVWSAVGASYRRLLSDVAGGSPLSVGLGSSRSTLEETATTSALATTVG